MRIDLAAVGSRFLSSFPEGEPKRDDGRIDFNYIRRVYAAMMPTLMATEKWVDPYFVDWVTLFTPIETCMWSLLRSQRVPFYPQFPIGRFFVDFGNPHRKVAIECDGAKWHDTALDYERDLELFEVHGWTVVRFSGRACLRMARLPDVFSVGPLKPVDSYWPPYDRLEIDEEQAGDL